jgi:type IV pilus assembly protein PilP
MAAAAGEVGANPAGGAGAAHAGGTAGAAEASRPPPLPMTDTDFTESDRTRDPFRSFAQEFVPVGPTIPIDQHVIKLREYTLDQLNLVAVILGTGNPYAMVIDPTDRGTIIRRGDYVGRPDTIAGAEGLMPHQVPWRVARIVGSRVTRDDENNITEVPGEVVFEREDRLNPNAPRVEHAITLTPGSQATRPSDNPQPALPALPAIPGFAPGSNPFLPTSPSTGGVGPIGAGGAGPAGSGTTFTNTTRQGNTLVQSYTQIVPGQPAQQAPPTTVTIQTDPHGGMTVQGPGQPATNVPVGPRDPYGPPPGGTNIPPPVQVNSGPTNPDPSLPAAGLPH